jgi:molybdenum cofactor biosynthesis protein B
VAGVDESRAFQPVKIAVLTISDTRTQTDDRSGATLVELIERDGHSVPARDLVRDDVEAIRNRVLDWVANPAIDVVITTGGTGLTARDVTPEALEALFDKRIDGFGELFRMLSYESVGVSTLQSRAVGGVVRGTYVFGLPGSPSACRDGWEKILKHQLDSRYRPCNLVELMPRLT